MELSILFDVFSLGQRVRTLLAAAMREAGMRPDEYAAYSVIFEAEMVTMTEMARILGMPVTTAADYVRAIHARGHLRKEPHPQDNRAQLLVLTAAGRRAHRVANECFERAYSAFINEFGRREERPARELLQRLSECATRATESMTATTGSGGR